MKMEDLELVKRYHKWGEYARKSQNQRLSAEDRLAEVVNTLNDVERDIKKTTESGAYVTLSCD